MHGQDSTVTCWHSADHELREKRPSVGW